MFDYYTLLCNKQSCSYKYANLGWIVPCSLDCSMLVNCLTRENSLTALIFPCTVLQQVKVSILDWFIHDLVLHGTKRFITLTRSCFTWDEMILIIFLIN